MKALSVRQPWASLILHAGKDVENRTWHTNMRGWVLLHASKTLKSEDWNGAHAFIAERELEERCACPGGLSKIMTAPDLPRGVIIGAVRIFGCGRQVQSPWYVGPYGFIINDRRVFAQPIPLRGQLNFFDVIRTPELNEQITLAGLEGIGWAA